MDVCVYVCVHRYIDMCVCCMYIYIYKEYERMAEMLRCDCARALHNIRIRVLYTKADIARIYAKNARDRSWFSHIRFDSFRFLYDVQIFAKSREERARARAHTREKDAIYTICIHTHMCATGT